MTNKMQVLEDAVLVAPEDDVTPPPVVKQATQVPPLPYAEASASPPPQATVVSDKPDVKKELVALVGKPMVEVEPELKRMLGLKYFDEYKVLNLHAVITSDYKPRRVRAFKSLDGLCVDIQWG